MDHFRSCSTTVKYVCKKVQEGATNMWTPDHSHFYYNKSYMLFQESAVYMWPPYHLHSCFIKSYKLFKNTYTTTTASASASAKNKKYAKRKLKRIFPTPKVVKFSLKYFLSQRKQRRETKQNPAKHVDF